MASDPFCCSCFDQSGRQDSNLRPSAPKAPALPSCATPRRFGAYPPPLPGAGPQYTVQRYRAERSRIIVVHCTLVISLPAGIDALALEMASVLLMIEPAVSDPACTGAVPRRASNAINHAEGGFTVAALGVFLRSTGCHRTAGAWPEARYNGPNL